MSAFPAKLESLRIQDGYWYLATPYSKHPGGIDRAFVEAATAAGRLLASGVPTYCPIAHTHPIAIHGGIDPYAHEIFLPLDERMMKGAHGILVVEMSGWEGSVGIAFELEFFKRAGREIIHLSWPELRMVRA